MAQNNKEFPKNIDGNFEKYYKDRVAEGYDKQEILRIINAFAMKDYSNGIISLSECAKFCLLWEKENGWENLEDKFIYRYWKSFFVDVETTPKKKKNKRNNESCPILEVDFSKKSK